MKAYFALLALVATSVYAQVNRQCGPTEVVYLLDHSENAKKASTLNDNNPFELLKTAWARHMRDYMAQSNGDQNIRVWAWAYSSRQEPKELVARNTSPNHALFPDIGNFTHGGSWTYRGLEAIAKSNATPQQGNNLIVVISAQGSFNDQRRQQTSTQYNILRQRGWNVYVIGVMSGSDIDRDELSRAQGTSTSVLTILDDGQATNKKSYRLLGDSLFSIVQQLCPITVPTTRIPTFRPQTPTYTPPPTIYTQPPPLTNTGICSNCVVESGFGYVRHPKYCDSMYRCLPDRTPVKMNCGLGLIWDSEIATCVDTKDFVCPVGVCDQYTPEGTIYPSGTCCNHFFVCKTVGALKKLVFQGCDPNNIFDESSGQCVFSADPVKACGINSDYCNHQLKATPDCDGLGFRADVSGDPCVYYHGNERQIVAEGTVWDQSKCRLVKSDFCRGRLQDKSLSTTCQASLISTWNAGVSDAYSPRTSQDIFVTNYGVRKTRGTAIFTPVRSGATPPAYYYYYFSKNEIPSGSAFRIVFQLANNARDGTVYDLLSNNYCGECQETISVTVRKVTGSEMIITASFTESQTNMRIQVPIQVDSVPRNAWVEYVVIWGASDVHGVVKVYDSRRSLTNQVNIPSVGHTKDGGILPNKCGLLLGRGSNQNFVGAMDVFAYYTMCTDIEDALNDNTM